MLLNKPQTLSEAQRRELEEVKSATRDSNVYRRAKVILYREAGYTADEIQEHTEYSERMQRYWVNRYRAEGVSGLRAHPRSGRPKQEALGGAAEPEEAPPIPKLAHWARVTLEEMHANHPKAYLRSRAHMVLLRDQGYSIEAISDIVRVTVRSVRAVLACYDQEKLMGLYRKPGSGRRALLRPDQWEQVKEWVQKGPKALGYWFVIWTTRSLRWYIYNKFSEWLSRERIRQVLHRIFRFSWTRAKKVWAYADDPDWHEERRRFCQQRLDLLEQARKGELLLLFLDETILTLAGELGYSWSPMGETQAVPSLGKKDRIVVFGAVDLITGRPHSRLEDRPITQESTLDFLKHLIRYYAKQHPGMPLAIVLDKHPGHTAGIIEDSVNQWEHVTLVHTPTQSPDLNPLERLWDWLAEQRIKNEFFETTTSLKQAVRRFFCYIAGVKEQMISWLGDLQKLYAAGAEI